MTFLNPIILLGLAAAALPLIIHLFNFRKPRKVDFSSLAFLKEVERSTMQRVRIKQWLLLALRTLAIAALVISFARPTLRGLLGEAFAGAAPVSIAVALDNSPSMSQRDAGGEYFDQARDLVQAIISETDSRDEVLIVPVHPGPGASPRFGPGGDDAMRRLDEVEVRSGTRSQLSAVVEAAELAAARLNQNREVYLVGDLQESTLVDSTEARIPGGSPVYVIPVGSGETGNIAVTAVEVRSRIVEADQPVRIAATLVNHSSTGADAYVSSMYLEGERVAQASTDLVAGGSSVVEFTVSPSGRGWLRGLVETEDDGFPADNRAWFSVFVPEERSILVIRGEGQDTRYLEAALGADPSRIALNVRLIEEHELASVDLSTFDAVMLVGPASLSTGESDRLAGYVAAGGGLLWFPSDRGRVSDYNTLLSALGGGTVVPPESSSGGPVDAVDRVDLDHPLFDGVLDASGGGIERPEIFRRMAYRPGSGTEAAVMQMSSGAPFLQEIRHGRGSVLLSAVAPEPTWSDLPTRGLFIPLLYRAVFLLSSSQTISGETYVAGGSGEVLVPGVTESDRLVVTDPAGQELAPITRPGVGGLLVTLDGMLAEPGHYGLQTGSGLVRVLAVNPDPAESDLRRAAATDAAATLAQRADTEVSSISVSAGTDAGTVIADARRGAELWNVFLGLALLFLVAEMFVAKQWKPESAT